MKIVNCSVCYRTEFWFSKSQFIAFSRLTKAEKYTHERADICYNPILDSHENINSQREKKKSMKEIEED